MLKQESAGSHMTQREAERRRTVNVAAMAVSLAVIGLLVISVLLAAVGPFSKAANDDLTPETAAGAVLGGCEVRSEDGRYWAVAAGPAASQLADLLQTAAWEEIDPFEPGEPGLVLRFWEECELCLYGDGRALFYDGYAARGEAVTACYRIPEETAAAVLDWLHDNGTPLEDPDAACFRF